MIIVIIIAAAGFIDLPEREDLIRDGQCAGNPDDHAYPLSEADRVSLEERIVQLIRANGGEQFQSEIVKVLGMPKSTVSSTLNDLHRRGLIQKIKKGRENLIRLINGSG